MKTKVLCRMFLFLFPAMVWAQAKDKYNEDMNITENIRYSEAAGKKGFGDLYLPKNSKGARPILLIHGGAWKYMNRYRMKRIAEFMTREGYAVFNVNYRLTPMADYPACEIDCLEAGKFLIDAGHPAMKQLNRDNIIVIGASAGGHLALMTGLKLPPERVAGIIDISGPTDLASPEIRGLMRGSGMFRGQKGKEYEDSLKAASPVTIASGKTGEELPPLLILHNQSDKIVELIQAEKILKIWNEKKRDVIAFFWSGGKGHSIWRPAKNGPFLHYKIEFQISAFLKSYFPKK